MGVQPASQEDPQAPEQDRQGDQGCWFEQEVRQDHWHCCRPPPQEQECGVSSAELSEIEGVQVEDDLVPHQRQEAKEGDATAEEMSKAVQLAGTKVMAPKAVTKRPRAMAITADMQAFKAFQTIRQARAFKRLHGIRAKKAADAEADELSKKK